MASRVARFAPEPRGSPLRAAWVQEAFWDVERELGGVPVFNIPMAATIGGPLDVGVLDRAFAFVIARHETLRTTLTRRADGLYQSISSSASVAIAKVDLGTSTRERAEAVAAERMIAPFDLANDGPIRADLYRFGPDLHLLSIGCHHAAVDAWSLDLMWHELWTAYDAYLDGREPALPILAHDFVDFWSWLVTQEHALRDELRAWQATTLSAIPVLELPTDRPRSATTGHDGASAVFSIPASLAERFLAVSARNNATPWIGFLAAFEILMANIADQADFAVGTPVSTISRAQRDAESLVGPLLNLFPIRVDLSGSPTFADHLARVRAAALESWSHRLVPWLWIAETAAPRLPGVSPHFQVMFNMIIHPPQPTPRGLALEIGNVAVDASEFDLTLTIYGDGPAWSGELQYKTGLFDRSSIDRLVADYLALMERAASHPNEPIIRAHGAVARGASLDDVAVAEPASPSIDFIHVVRELALRLELVNDAGEFLALESMSFIEFVLALERATKLKIPPSLAIDHVRDVDNPNTRPWSRRCAGGRITKRIGSRSRFSTAASNRVEAARTASSIARPERSRRASLRRAHAAIACC